MPYNVIDVSKHQVTFEPNTARAKGVNGIIARLAYSAGKDNVSCGWIPAIKQSGLKVGGYGFGTWHYMSNCHGNVNTARSIMTMQVNKWVSIAKECKTNWWIAIDQELESGNQMGLGMQDNTRLINEAADIIRAAGFYPVLYCSVAWDINYIKTADLRVDYWMARYFKGDWDFSEASLDVLPDGQYTRWMKKLYSVNRLVGWQFGSTGRGRYYGAGSDNLDKNLFYLNPAATEPDREQDVKIDDKQLAYISVGPMSRGDIVTFCDMFADLQIAYDVTDEGFVKSLVECSTGDQVKFINKAAELAVGISLTSNAPAPKEHFEIVHLNMIIKEGFETADDAIDYICSVLGNDAINRYGIEVKKA